MGLLLIVAAQNQNPIVSFVGGIYETFRRRWRR